MTVPSDAVLDEMAGGPVATLADAQDVEAVTAEDVTAADTAERKAAESERAAVTGKVTPAQAASDHEASRFASLRARLTQRKRERYRQAQRLIQLNETGQAALQHAAALTGVRESVQADLAKIADLRQAISDCIANQHRTGRSPRRRPARRRGAHCLSQPAGGRGCGQ